jgi:protein tyrosine/serine phosphatase
LRDDPLPWEGWLCQQLGLDYVNVPMSGFGKPDAEKVSQAVCAVLSNGGNTLIHCQHGSDRTSVVVAEFRKWQGWTAEAAFEEAQSYGLSPFLPGFRSFILRNLPR